jgi:excinuclease ABC subunit B
MQKAIDETTRRREMQMKFNAEHGITPQTVQKAIRASLESEVKARQTVQDAIHSSDSQLDQTELIKLLEEEMLQAAQNLEFERAAQLRDKINELRGAPVIHSSSGVVQDEAAGSKIWQPKLKGRAKRRMAK